MGWFTDLFRTHEPEQGAASKRTRPGKKVIFRSAGIESGENSRLTASWSSNPAHIVQLIERYWLPLCARGRDAALNIDHGKRFLRLVSKNICGAAGVQVIPQVTLFNDEPDHAARKALTKAYKDWCKAPEITGTLSMKEVERLMLTHAARDGEVFVRLLRGRDFGSCRLSLQLIDPVRIDPRLREDMRDGRRIRSGIEFNQYGKPLAYYVRVDEDQYFTGTTTRNGRRYDRVPAEDMIHLFLPEFIGQPRGLSWMGVALTRLRNLSKYEDAAVINARVGAAKMGFFKADPEKVDFDNDDDELDFPMDAEPGAFEELPLGYALEEWNPQYPQGEFEVFVRAMLNSVAAGLDVSYASLTGDLAKANYSSLRAGLLDERETWKELQDWFISKAISRIFEEWVSMAVLAGAVTIGNTPLRPERVEQYKAARYQGRRWPWVDPEKDAKAQKLEQDARMRSISSSIRERGDDPEDVFAEIKEEREAMCEAGILPEAKSPQPSQQKEPTSGKE